MFGACEVNESVNSPLSPLLAQLQAPLPGPAKWHGEVFYPLPSLSSSHSPMKLWGQQSWAVTRQAFDVCLDSSPYGLPLPEDRPCILPQWSQESFKRSRANASKSHSSLLSTTCTISLPSFTVCWNQANVRTLQSPGVGKRTHCPMGEPQSRYQEMMHMSLKKESMPTT